MSDGISNATSEGGMVAEAPGRRGSWVGGDFWARYGVLLALVVMALVFVVLSDRFLTQDNLVNILRQSAVTAIAAVGATMVLIAGGIDISQGAVMAFAGLSAVVIIEQMGGPDVVAIAVALLFATVFGLANGVL
jgi:ribose/xylose/arabinose/galactoside ABC-type transport system permease subunit